MTKTLDQILQEKIRQDAAVVGVDITKAALEVFSSMVTPENQELKKLALRVARTMVLGIFQNIDAVGLDQVRREKEMLIAANAAFMVRLFLLYATAIEEYRDQFIPKP